MMALKCSLQMFLPTSNSSNLVFVYLVSVFDGSLTGPLVGQNGRGISVSWLLSLWRSLLAVAQLLADN